MRDVGYITYDTPATSPEYTAVEERQIQTSHFLRDTNDLVMAGVRGGAVSNTGSSVTIAPLTMVVQPSAALGVYKASFPASASELSKTISAAHATLARVDALDVKIFDTEADSSGNRGGDIQINAGTAGSGTAPGFVGVGVRLGTFAVPASGGGSPVFTANPNLVGYAAAGGILDVAARPSNPRPGTVIHNRLTSALEIYYSGAWRNIMTSVWTTWDPTWTATTTNPQKGNGVKTGAYRYVGGMIDAAWKYTYGTTFVVGVGGWSWSVPVPVHADWNLHPIGQLVLHDSSAGAWIPRTCVNVSSTTAFAAFNDAGSRMGPTSPVPDTGDDLAIVLRYRPADEAP